MALSAPSIIDLVPGAEWVISGSLQDSEGTLLEPIDEYTISAKIVSRTAAPKEDDSDALLLLTEANGRVTIGATAEDITFRIDEHDTFAIPYGMQTKLVVKIVHDGVTFISKNSALLRVLPNG